MSSLWRTQRPRFPHYISDGNGRDYYIKYNNAGYWEGQFKIYKKPDYEYPKYSNYHTLFHQAAPFKYYATGNGRETYIINAGGLYHEQKPLASYKLDDFLRGSKTIQDVPMFPNKKRYLSLGEKKYNSQLKSLEKNLIKRLYGVPKKNKKTADITSAASIISLKLSFFYLVSTFAFLQMYIASTAATASTASEIIVKIIMLPFLNL